MTSISLFLVFNEIHPFKCTNKYNNLLSTSRAPAALDFFLLPHDWSEVTVLDTEKLLDISKSSCTYLQLFMLIDKKKINFLWMNMYFVETGSNRYNWCGRLKESIVLPGTRTF